MCAPVARACNSYLLRNEKYHKRYLCVVSTMAQIPAAAAARIARVAGHIMRPAPTAGAAGGMLEGQVAIITGSGQGIGAATALLFAQQGAAITVCDIDATKAHTTAASITAAGGRAIVVAGDVNGVA